MDRESNRESENDMRRNLENLFNGDMGEFFSMEIQKLNNLTDPGSMLKLRIPACFGILDYPYKPNNLYVLPRYFTYLLYCNNADYI